MAKESNNIKDYPTLGLLFPSRYLSADDLKDGQLVHCIIAEIEPRHELETERGSDWKPAVQLTTLDGRPMRKKWVLNKTNGRVIGKIHGSEVLGWAGKPITLKIGYFSKKYPRVIKVEPRAPNVPIEKPMPREEPPPGPEPEPEHNTETGEVLPEMQDDLPPWTDEELE